MQRPISTIYNLTIVFKIGLYIIQGIAVAKRIQIVSM